jgi:hypothetical protein
VIPMALEDIIKEETDRLLIIDRECYIIYTGSSLDDEKPFIRIGNYKDLPAEIIPLIETIAIPDKTIGDPAHEKFNIDVKHLSSNRFIGSRPIVTKYLEFQRLFGLDLQNATIVDVEKDIPILSKEKLISSRDAFIGIFYTNGNFRIIHEGKTIFDLNDIEKIANDDIKIHDTISQAYSDTTKFKGSGIIVLDNNLLFYKEGYFTAYQFPERYFRDFSALSIDLQRIREILQPSSNFTNLIRFLKWKNSNSGQLQIFCDDSEAVDLIGRHFSNITLNRNTFQGLSYNTGEGLTLKNYINTHNIKATYEKTELLKKDISIAYIKSSSGIGSIIREDLDGIFIDYSVYEDTNLIFKSVSTPLAVIDDGNRNISRLRGERPIKLYRGIQYEMQRYNEIEEIFQEISYLSYLSEITAVLSRGDRNEIATAIARYQMPDITGDSEKRIESFNVISILKTILDITSDRKFAATIKEALLDLNRTIDSKDVLGDNTSSCKIILAFLKSSIHEYIVPVDGSAQKGITVFDEIDEKNIEKFNRIPDPAIRDYYLRIIHDRKRLQDLLSFLKPSKEKENDPGEHRELVRKQKRQYADEDVYVTEGTIQRETGKKRRIKTGAIILTAITAFLILYFLTQRGMNYYREYRLKEKPLLEEKKRTDLIKQYTIKITDNEIFSYANKVAKRNGYRGITSSRIREKNPHWIYPGNKFAMLDGETVTVSEGDTLWGLSYKKVMKIHLEFYETVNRIKEGKKTEKEILKDIERLKKLAFTEEHHQIISSLIEKR